MRRLFRATLPLLLLAACVREPAAPHGSYRAIIAAQAGSVPFGIDVEEQDGKPVASIVDGGHRFIAEATRFSGGMLTLDFPSYESSLEAKIGKDGSLAGAAHLYRRSGRLDLPLILVPGAGPVFFPNPAPPAVELAGSWPIAEDGADGEKGVLLLSRRGNALSGSIQFPSGDERYLAGEVSGDRFALSTFDGNQGSVWRGQIRPDGTLAGDSFGLASAKPGGWTSGKRGAAPAPGFVPVAEEKPPTDHIAFSFPDADGHMVSIADPRFRGKVVVVAIGGTWCPNCHDEAAFLAPYYKAHAARGLEMIGLQFEYDGDHARSARQIRSFAARYAIAYPLLIAGKATAEDSKRALPAIGGVKVYPTTLFIDRKGKLRAIHVGWSGPATGALNKQAEAQFDTTVTKLLAEKG
ncbi:MAG: TlpA family protein disulfide reductase [Sphingomonadaceae bacterium]|nr:TlpA family protein disulfide reductase [Sphingomonadaceae bacterium]